MRSTNDSFHVRRRYAQPRMVNTALHASPNRRKSVGTIVCDGRKENERHDSLEETEGCQDINVGGRLADEEERREDWQFAHCVGS